MDSMEERALLLVQDALRTMWSTVLVLEVQVDDFLHSESVDSICRDSADTQYMLIQTNFSKSPKQLTYKPLKHPIVHFWVFSWRKTHPVALKSIAKTLNQVVARRPKCFSFFFFFFFFFFFRRASSNLRVSFTMVFAQNSSIFHWAAHQPIAFFHIWSHTRQFESFSMLLLICYPYILLHFNVFFYSCSIKECLGIQYSYVAI